jgi:hypothetical protein
MGLVFAPNWQQWQQFPFNERRLTAILHNVRGALGHAINVSNEEVRVIAGIHAGGAPGARQDPLPHVTLSWNHRTYHVRLNQYGHILEVTG